MTSPYRGSEQSYFEITPQDDEASARQKILERLVALGDEFAGAQALLFDFLSPR